MRILFLSAANSIHTVRWVNSLCERGHEIYLVYNKNHGPNCDQIREHVHLYQLKNSGCLAYYSNAYELKKLSKKIKPDVIHVHYASGYGTLARIAKLKNVLLSVWGSDVYDFPIQNRLNKWILQKNINYAKAITSTSHCMAEQLRSVVNVGEKEILITPFGVDLQLYTGNRSENKNKIILGNVKSLKKIYGIDDFIQSVALLLANLKQKGYNEIADQIEVNIYGSGEQKEVLQEMIANLKLDKQVYLKGKIPNIEVPRVLREFDIFCATSHQESFGVSLVEAMAMKVPIVASAAEGFKEVVLDGVTGYIVPVSDIQAIAKKLERLVMDKELRIKMGEAGRKHVEQWYDWEKNVTVMEKIYDEMRAK